MRTEVTKDIWRGPRPTDLRELKREGFTRVISLQSGFEEIVTDSPLEFQDPYECGIKYYHLNWSNVFVPSAQKVLRLLSIIHDGTGRKTLIHCHSGVDRTGFACAVIRMRLQNWGFDMAHDEFVSMGRHWWFWWWKTELKKWERQ